MILKIVTSVISVIMLRTLAFQSPTGQYYFGLVTYFVSLAVCSILGMVLSVGMALVGRRFDMFMLVARSFYYLEGALSGIRIEIEGEEHLTNRPAVYIGNHQSMLDILYLGRIFPRGCTIMAKKELKWTPLLGQFMSLGGAVFVNRSRKEDALKSMADAGETMKERNISLFIFPEGTRKQHETPNLLPFKKGAFHLAVQSGIPIVPMVCENYWHLYRKGVFSSGVLKVRVLPPIPTTNLKTEDVNDLTTRTRELMLQALCDLSPDLPPPSPSVKAPTPVSEIASPSSEVPPSRQPSFKAPESQGLRRRAEGEGSRRDDGEEDEDGMVIVDRPSS